MRAAVKAPLAALAIVTLVSVGAASAQESAPSPADSLLPDPTLPDPPLDDVPEGQAPADPAAGLPSQTIEGAADDGDMVSPILSVDADALFGASIWGKRVQTELEAQGSTLQAENDRLARQLSDEEAALTAERPDLDPAVFRQRAEAFDSRATTIRRERAQAVADLNARAEADRNAFYQAALPLMGTLMQERGAVAVLDRRTVFVSVDQIDITEELIARIDAELGDGAENSPLNLPSEAATTEPQPEN
ncbi:OmpH family outer membrane protein [Paracoccus sp. TK19116]|uniref:OmpH family outer membrane protein n=1 Tax=Paracoccus albicereus TaxID=2922394 RepID=A0ABT1MQ31_9RHOB|nr:OmpH family outer membrane protein [Paracoccus albicereus]MCQ0970417.1 OmpH family outer membrane protein [Paracoccus albicereus]